MKIYKSMSDTLRNLALAVRSGDKTKIHEASINRIYQHWKGEASDSFAIVSAFRQERSNRENIQATKRLESLIRSLGLGFFKLKGHWLECPYPDMEYEDCPKNELVHVTEVSLFVPNMTKAQAVKMAKEFKQDSVIYKGADTKGKIQFVSPTGSVQFSLSSFIPKQMGDMYSSIRGGKKKFTFEGYELIPRGYTERMVYEHYLKSM